MKSKRTVAVAAVLIALVIVGVLVWRATSGPQDGAQSGTRAIPDGPPLRVAISAYQDLAMLTAYKDLKLEEKYGVRLELVTLDWEKVLESLGSAGPTVDVGFGSLIEFLTKYENINSKTSDPLVYAYPAYVFKGGGFISFNPAVPDLDATTPPPPELLRKFFTFRLGAQKKSMFDMVLFTLSEQAGIRRDQLRITDTTMTNGLLAAQQGSLDAAAAGLTQRNEALTRGGRVVLTMEKFGFADLTGMIAKQSTLQKRHGDIEKFVRIWFDCVNFVYSDIDKNSAGPLRYLKQKSSTQYTVDSYKRALESEYLPRSVKEANDNLVADSGQFSISRISQSVTAYLVRFGIIKSTPPVPKPIQVAP